MVPEFWIKSVYVKFVLVECIDVHVHAKVLSSKANLQCITIIRHMRFMYKDENHALITIIKGIMISMLWEQVMISNMFLIEFSLLNQTQDMSIGRDQVNFMVILNIPVTTRINKLWFKGRRIAVTNICLIEQNLRESQLMMLNFSLKLLKEKHQEPIIISVEIFHFKAKLHMMFPLNHMR